MDPERLKATQRSIMEAYERIPIDGPQVRFIKCTHRSGHLEGNKLLGLHACTAYIPDEDRQRLEDDRILTRLRVSNKALHTSLWTVLGKTPSTKGQVWTFSMDEQSIEEIKKLNMHPFFGIGRIKFRLKEQGQRTEEKATTSTSNQDEAGPSEGSDTAHQEPGDLPSGQSPLRRQTAQQRAVPMEMEKATEEAQEDPHVEPSTP